MADDLKRVGLKLTADGAQDFKKALKDCTTATKENYSELKLAQSQYDKNTTATQKLEDRQKYLKEQTEIYSDKVQILTRQLEEMESAENKNETAIAKKRTELNEAQTKLNDYEKSLKDVNDQLEKHTAQLKEWGDKLQDAGEKMQGFGDKVKGVGESMTTHVTAPIAAVGTASAAMAMDFETSMAKLSTIADTTQVPMEDLEQAILDLSNQTGISASDIAESTYNAISAGQDTADAVDYVGNAMMLAKAGFADAGSALDILTTITNAYGMSADEAAHISDVLITTQNKGKTTVGDLASTMGKIIPTANMFGVNLENISAGYVTMTKNGIGTAEATTYMNSMLNELGKSGTTASAILKDKTGKSFSELMDSGMSLTDVLQILEEEAQKNGKSMADMFGSDEAGKAAAVMTQHVEDFSGALTEMTDGSREAGEVTNEAFQKVDSTKAEQLKKTLNEVKNTGIELGTTLLEMLGPAMDWLKEKVSALREWWESLDESQQKQIISIAGVVAVVGPVITVIGSIISGIGGIVTAIGVLLPIIGAISAPVLIVIGIIAAAIAIGVLLYQNWDTIKEKAAELRDKVVEKWNALKEGVASAIDTTKQRVIDGWNTMKDNVYNTVEGIKQNVREKWDSIKENVSGAVESIKSNIQEKFDAAKEKASEVWENLKSNTSTAWSNIRSSIEEHGGGITGIIGAAMDGYKSTWENGMIFLDDITGGKLTGIYNWFHDKFEDVKNYLGPVADWIQGLFNFEWSLPDLKLPHIIVDSYIDVPVIGTIPDPFGLHVDWYRRAYTRAAYYTSPTMRSDGRGYGDGQGGEFAVGESHLRDVIREESGNDRLISLVEMIINLLANRTPTNLIINQAPGEDVRELAREVAELINLDYDQEEAVFA